MADYGNIEVRGARENNLHDVSVDIPKRALTVFTGVSGSGKSSLVFGTIAAESQRLINETYSAFLQSFMGAPRRPDVDDLRNLSAAIVVDQERMAANSRSTVGTATDTYTRLRVMFSRLGTPFVGGPNRFSFNDPQGMCPTCEGSGRTSGIDLDALIDRSKSLDEGPILFPGYAVDSWPWQIFADSGFFDRSKPLADYTDDEMQRFLYGDTVKVKVGTMNLTYEGLVSKIRRSYLSKDPDALQPHIRAAVDRFAVFIECPDCNGARLAPEALACRIAGRSIADCAAMQISDLADFLDTLELDESAASVRPMRDALRADLQALVDIGLGYLSLNRPAATLSGGEAQRVKMVRHVGSPLTDLTYVFDEPTVGLHAHDIERMNHLLKRLRDKGNTVLVVEHKPAVMRIADHIVDLGPGAGSAGGRVMYEGPYDGLRRSGTVTGEHLGSRQSVKTEPRSPTGRLRIEHANTHNLRDVSVDVPLGVLTAVTGVAGSGKSTLIHQHLVAGNDAAGSGMVTAVDQAPIRGSRRSNPGTYTGVLDGVRAQFAKVHGVKPGLFSFNSDGACPGCSGLGMVYSDLVFMAGVASLCEQCEGKRFTPEVLAMTLRGHTITDVLDMAIVDAAELFSTKADKAIAPMLGSLVTVGLGYIRLGQALSTLSGGERQRLKLAIELGSNAPVFVLDEPTSGLHMADIDRLIDMLDHIVDSGRTVVVIEHNLDVIARADWVIDMGPGAGHDGGVVVFEGPPADLCAHHDSLTGRHLAQLLAAG